MYLAASIPSVFSTSKVLFEVHSDPLTPTITILF